MTINQNKSWEFFSDLWPNTDNFSTYNLFTFVKRNLHKSLIRERKKNTLSITSWWCVEIKACSWEIFCKEEPILKKTRKLRKVGNKNCLPFHFIIQSRFIAAEAFENKRYWVFHSAHLKTYSRCSCFIFIWAQSKNTREQNNERTERRKKKI